MKDREDREAVAGTHRASHSLALTSSQRRAGLLAILFLTLAGIVTLKGFLPALIWAAILTIALSPMFNRLAARFPRHRHTLVPLGIVVMVLLIFVVPLAIVTVPLVEDAHSLGTWVAHAKTDGVPPPAVLTSLPHGDRIAGWWANSLGQPGRISAMGAHLAQGSAFQTARTVGAHVLHRLILLGFTLMTLFFLLRDADAVSAELRVGSRRAFGPAGEHVARQVVRSIHGTVNGLVLVGLVEGLLLGVVYAVAGVPHAAMLGLLTAVLAMIPFGAPLAFGAAALLLAASSKLVAAAIVLAVGMITTFVADHFVRPVLIGSATRLPFIWVLLGILGGVEVWGLVGLFLGPAIMAALLLLWREWVGAQKGPLNPLDDAILPTHPAIDGGRPNIEAPPAF